MTTISFDHATTGYSLAHARCLAYAAELAYKDEKRGRATLNDWGFDRVTSFRVPHTPPFPLRRTPPGPA
ncbi:hypothetical protein [Nonomuraea jabiensis]|uniref:hypothetical protein n=1 Tax=Nonomuraea jabiensis TaxID=882448 RepID=UPI003D72369F